MARRLVNLATLLSALLSVAVLVMWVRGRGRTEYFWHDTSAGPGVGFASSLGQFRFYLRSPLPSVRANWEPERWQYNSASPPIPFAWKPDLFETQLDLNSVGFHLWVGPSDEGRHYRMIIVPCWAVLLAAASPLLWRGRRAYRSRRARLRRASNLCAACGYDLRATLERCPECGTEQPGAQPARVVHQLARSAGPVGSRSAVSQAKRS